MRHDWYGTRMNVCSTAPTTQFTAGCSEKEPAQKQTRRGQRVKKNPNTASRCRFVADTRHRLTVTTVVSEGENAPKHDTLEEPVDAGERGCHDGVHGSSAQRPVRPGQRRNERRRPKHVPVQRESEGKEGRGEVQ